MQIKNRWTNEVIFEGEYATIRLCVEGAAAQKKSLYGANLSRWVNRHIWRKTPFDKYDASARTLRRRLAPLFE